MGEYGISCHVSVEGLENDVESVSLSKFSEQESDVNHKSEHLKFIKIVLNSI